ncbi:MAG: hypothetical protein K0R93_280 [Anaerosolibacter sp.]|uniref:hypothetical protein n=1 Tax=Anaerosolibacter sp. TaxID=1872527 RepID=UPI002601C6FC|nr:hypothetical protein [Anaerosolibacter sp.]MDF2545382.1 hypothetical protein [Anaerosolibacter sp.]
MKRKFSTIIVVVVSGLMLFGCAQSKGDIADQPDPNSNPAGIVLAGADQEKNISLEDVKTIELYDLDGKLVNGELNKEEIVKAFNDSMIDDTSYIQMITGYRMVITLKDDGQINISSYGDETRVVAMVRDTTYHLISPELAKILLGK